MKFKKTASMLIMALSITLIGSSSVLAAPSDKITTENSVKIEVKNNNYNDIITQRGGILSYEDFAAIKVEMEKNKGKVTEETVKKLIVKKIIDKEKATPSVTDQYTIWGKNLTGAELALVVLYPVYAVYVYNDAQTADSEARRLYQSSTLYLGNGDAFRHTYWNALMTKNVGSFIAELFATAHESDTPDGVDKTMDLNNNYTGRNIGLYYSSSVLESTVITYVNNGWLNRVVNGELTVTDSSGRL